MDLQLRNKTALVTGSTAGIGFGIASLLAQEGAAVLMNGRSQRRVDEGIERIRQKQKDAQVTGVAADLGTRENRTCSAQFGVEKARCRVPLRLTMRGDTENQMTAKIAPLLPTLEDSTLIALVLAGRTECFAVLVDRHGATVRRRIASIVRNAADADDVLQETLLKVWRRWDSFCACHDAGDACRQRWS